MRKSIATSLEAGDLSSLSTYQAGVMQAATHRMLQKHCDDILQPYGISKMQWLIIGLVRDEGPAGARVTDLAEKMGTTLSYLTNAVNLLESKDILVRTHNDEDSRSKLVSINDTFAKKCDEIEAVMRRKLRESVYAEVDPQDFRTYMKVLHQLSKVGTKK